MRTGRAQASEGSACSEALLAAFRIAGIQVSPARAAALATLVGATAGDAMTGPRLPTPLRNGTPTGYVQHTRFQNGRSGPDNGLGGPTVAPGRAGQCRSKRRQGSAMRSASYRGRDRVEAAIAASPRTKLSVRRERHVRRSDSHRGGAPARMVAVPATAQRGPAVFVARQGSAATALSSRFNS